MSDLHICQDCGALFEGDEIVFDMDSPDEDGDIAGQCPECSSTYIFAFE